MCKVNCYKSVLIFFISAAVVIPQKLVTAKQTLCENLLKVDFEHYIQVQATPKKHHQNVFQQDKKIHFYKNYR